MKIALALGVLGAIATVLLGLHDPTRAVMGALAAFGVALAASLGALILAMVFQVTNAKWPSAIEPLLMAIVRTLPGLLVLFVPIALLLHRTHPEPEIPQQKLWLATPFLLARAVVYFAIWIGLGEALSRAQNKKTISGAGIPLVAITLTLASFDWFMAIEPGWVSNMYGVYFFAGGLTGALAVIALLARTNEYVTGAVGRLLFMSVVFWAYIAFFQLMLVWIADLPHEVGFYALRWQSGYEHLALLLLFGKFVIPFLVLLPYANKRRPALLAAVGAWLLVMDAGDLAWLILPRAGGALRITDLAPFCGVLGLASAFGAARAA